MTTVSAERLASIFREVAGTLVDDFDLVDFLHTLTDRATNLVGAAATGLLMADPRGLLRYMAASDENAKLLELLQLQNDEGPGLDAFTTGRPVVNVDLGTAAGRWPRFAPRAASAGYRSAHAFPLQVRRQVIGVMNVFGATGSGDFAAADVSVMQALTDVAAIGLLQARTIRQSEVLTEQLQSALHSRIVIEQSKGAVAQACGVTVGEAFTAIRRYAREQNRKLTDVAYAITTEPGLAARIITR
ncbi:transcriptional regulator [Actinoplanes cyaneus]|uniref:Transcriptional regulator n=1 Tax=Actinoplanes cyaneus TaxID=52696 RepID=A0A919M7Z9_9ACTN|nr:GAF and ANTAR domain-containing protein [Actinoplanes cyaneus]MCW2142288.1 ANTAR domain-containing protein [Actinoplanes cyaneus]GID69307.1 transcriptional regulator [Actinoplanes cyaneus]